MKNIKPIHGVSALAAILIIWIGTALIGSWKSGHASRTGAPEAALNCMGVRREPFRIPGMEGATAIAFQSSHLVVLDGEGRMRSYLVTQSPTCEGQATSIDPAHSPMSRIAPSAVDAIGITSTGTLATWEAQERTRMCPSGIRGSVCGAFLKEHITGLREITGSASHLLMVTQDGSVMSTGMNDCGQTGRPLPHLAAPRLDIDLVPGLSDIVQVASGKRSSMALGKDGRVWTWGNLSHPLIESSSPPQPTLDAVYCGGYENPFHLPEAANPTPEPVAGLPPITAISSFHGFDLALDRKGRVWGWGYNDCGQLGGDPTTLVERGGFQYAPAIIEGLPPITAMAAGRRHALFLGTDGSIWATGDNEFGQLATKATLPFGGQTCVSSTQRGGLDPYSGKPVRIEGIPTAKAVAADNGHSAAIDEDGHVWIWGRYP